MKAPLKARRPTPAEALAIVDQAAPSQPPAQRAEREQEAQEVARDVPTTLNLRLRYSTVAAIEQAARRNKLTLKLVVTQALQAAGVEVAAADLEDRTPRRKM